jgi:heme exporter protein C
MRAWLTTGAALLALMTGYYFVVPDAKVFAEPALARTLFFHVPNAFLATLFLFAAGWLGYRYLRTHQPRYDTGVEAATELGLLFSVLTLVTGIFFSRVQWGDWWHWDPRQTSFLMVVLMFAAALALRAGLPEGERRSRACAAYSLAIVLPATFLTFVFPRLPAVKQASFHPTQTIAEGQLDAWYRVGMYGTFLALGVFAVGLYRLRVMLGKAEAGSKDYGLDSTLDGSAAPVGVGRLMVVPTEPRSPTEGP